ncbi:MAG: M56 family metallopeptidase [Nocardioides sp.]|nr:M56 family metallopeptidase [Nocardioides sp.]
MDPALVPLVLAALALLLAGPVPALLARATGLRRTPRAAMMLWQSVALAAVLAALGSGLSLVTVLVLAEEPGPSAWVLAAVSLGLTGLVGGRLLLSGHRVGVGVRSLRRRHRALVDVLAERREGVSVIGHEVPVAYCLPGLLGARVVLSEGAVARLSPAELEAVLTHERAHLRARHDLVLEAFGVLHRAFPRYVSSAAALREVTLLVEVLADAAAVRRTGPAPLLRALAALAGSRTPEAALGAGAGIVARVAAIEDPGAGWSGVARATFLYLASVAVLLLPTLLVVRPWVLGLA